MSPYDYNDDAFWREREKETIVTDVRHNFAFVFQQVVMIHKFYYTDSNLSTKAEEVMEAAKKMFEKEQLSGSASRICAKASTTWARRTSA